MRWLLKGDDPVGLSDSFTAVFPNPQNPFINLCYLCSLMHQCCAKGKKALNTWEKSTLLRTEKLIRPKSDISNKSVAYLGDGVRMWTSLPAPDIWMNSAY